MSDFARMIGSGLLGWAIGLAVALTVTVLLFHLGVSLGFIGGMILGGGLSLTGYAVGSVLWINRRYP